MGKWHIQKKPEIGISKMTHNKLSILGLLIIFLGVIFLLDNLNVWDVGEVIATFWPLSMIAIGFWMLRRKSRGKGSNRVLSVGNNSAATNGTNDRFIGDIERQFETDEFDGDHYSTIIGDIRLDLRDVRFEQHDYALRTFSVFGDVEIMLPEKLGLQVRVHSGFGDSSILGEKHSDIFRTIEWVSPDYNKAKNRLTLVIRNIVGDVRIGNK